MEACDDRAVYHHRSSRPHAWSRNRTSWFYCPALCERNQRRRDMPSSLMRYSKVPLPRERLSSKPKLHSLLKYVQAERAGEKLSRSAASFGPSHSPWVAANKDRTCSLSSLYRFICFPRACSCVIKS